MAHVFRYDDDVALVKTKCGLVHGYEYDGISVFKGIPYAHAKRFHSPVSTEPWEGILDATKFGPVPMIREPGLPDNEMLVPHRFWPMSEDCQNLNIWTPGLDDKKRPVMLWIHGGGFVDGSAIEQDVYDGQEAAQVGDIVFVSVNHRLNILGYSDLSAFGEEYKNSANLGMEDLVVALQWVKDNIEAFGGDPENVTLYGQSGGGGKIATLMQMPAADGLYQKAVIISGLMTTKNAVQPDRSYVPMEAMKLLGLEKPEELEAVPYKELFEAFMKVSDNKAFRVFPWKNDYFLGYPTTFPFRPETANVPLMTGTVFGESTPFQEIPKNRSRMTREEQYEEIVAKIGKEGADTIIPLFEKAYPERNIIDVLKLEDERRGIVKRYTKERAKFGPETYQYLFAYDFPINGGLVPWHCSDICFFFHDIDRAPYTAGPGAKELEDVMFKSVLAFMRTGNPSNEKLEWKPVTPEESNTMILDENPRILSNYDDELLAAVEKYVTPAMNGYYKGLKEKHNRS